MTGAVLRPGRINADHPLTVLDAVLAAGIDYTRANLKAVRIICNEKWQTEHHLLNLKKVLQDQQDVQFKLKPNDIITSSTCRRSSPVLIQGTFRRKNVLGR